MSAYDKWLNKILKLFVLPAAAAIIQGVNNCQLGVKTMDYF